MERIPETDKEAWKKFEELSKLYGENWEEEPRTANSNIPVEEWSYELLELVEKAVAKDITPV